MEVPNNVESEDGKQGSSSLVIQRRSNVQRTRRKSNSKPYSSCKRKTEQRKRQGFAPGDLPTPPPDPVDPFPEVVEGVAIENVTSNAAATALGVDDAFDNLDKLHSMIEQILEMRDRNAKLFKRVRQLERIRATRKAHDGVEKCILMGQDPLLPDEDVGFAESLLGAMLTSNFDITSPRSSTSSRITRSRSVGMEYRRVSCPVTTDGQNRNSSRPMQRMSEHWKKRPLLAPETPKVSKWTRVKAAFKWERAACTNADVPVEPELSVRYLRIPENAGGSSEVSGPPTPAGTISSSSSIDDVFHRPHRPSSNQSSRITRRDENTDPSRRSRSLDGDASVPMTFVYSPRTRSKDGTNLHGKSVDSRGHKTPWGKVKDMMQLRRDSLSRQPTRSGSRNEDTHSTSSLESSDILRSEQQQADRRPPRIRITAESTASLTSSSSKALSTNATNNELIDLATRRLTPTLTITVPSSEELRSISSPESITPPPPTRQNSESTKSERFSQGGYEAPKETRTGQVSPASSGSGILRYGLGRSKTCQGVPFAGDFKRQQSLKGESLGSSPKMQRRDSKWNKVKRAFLTSATSVPTSPSRISSYFFDDGEATGGSYSASASAEDLDNDSPSNPGAQAEIQRNYRLLHDKLGAEFYRKLAEWERLKSNTALTRDSTRSSARDRDTENLRLLGEDRLTPEFKKKLEEWKRMNKQGGSGESRAANSNENRCVGRRRITDWQLWRSSSKPDSKTDGPRISEDFLKKMEEWKRIKAAAVRRDAEVEAEFQLRETEVEGVEEEEEVEVAEEAEENEREEHIDDQTRGVADAAQLSEERRRRAWKSLEDEEFRSLDRVLDTMEIERQTRLSKLQRIVGSTPHRTEEVLVHTSTGLYRFEGISRKFTRKLYEWEKSQGISPELSTFRLLDSPRYGVGSSNTRETRVGITADGAPRRSLHRSKSTGNVQIDSWRTSRDDNKPSERRPSSLSLNDIDNLEARSCILDLSIPTIPDEEDTSEDIAMEDSEPEPEQEPEAVIVDIEDVIEETASPLTKYQPHQTPVYSVAGSETTSIAIPLGTVTARHEPSPVILIEPGEMHPLRARASCSTNQIHSETSYALESDSVRESAIPFTVASSTMQVHQQRSIVGHRKTERVTTHGQQNERWEDKLPRDDRVGWSEERTVVAAVASAVAETTAEKKNIVDGSVTCDRQVEDSNTRLGGNWRIVQLTHAYPGECGPVSRVLSDKFVTEEDEAFEDAVVTVGSNVRHTKKILKTRRLTDTQVGYDWRSNYQGTTSSKAEERPEDPEESAEVTTDFEDNPNVERIIINEDTLNKIVVPTAPSSNAMSISLCSAEDDPESRFHNCLSRKEKREPTSVFVKTKRIVFFPFRRESKNKCGENCVENVGISKSSTMPNVNSITNKLSTISNEAQHEAEKSSTEPISMSQESNTTYNEFVTQSEEPRTKIIETKRPPLPSSPILGRKEYRISSPKESVAPSIRMMIRKYNEKLENEISTDRSTTQSCLNTTSLTSSANSSGSGSSSPSWRTPIIERRLLNRVERSDENKRSASSSRICCEMSSQTCDHFLGLAKSSACTDLRRQNNCFETPTRIIMKQEPFYNRVMDKRSPSIQSDDRRSRTESTTNDRISASSIRAMRIRQAKEEFLSRGPSRDDSLQEKRIEVQVLSEGYDGGSENQMKKEDDDIGIERECAATTAARMDLVKSASAGMINVDADTYERLQLAAAAAAATRVSDSLPRSNEHLRHPAATKTSISRFSQIASKFKRARLRRAKENESKSEMSTVSMLCRQSLLVDIASGSGGSGSTGNCSEKSMSDLNKNY